MYTWVLKFSQSCKCQTQSTYSSFMYWYIIIGRWWKKSLKKSANHRQSSSSLFSTSGKILSSMSEPNPNPCIHLVKFRPPLSPTAASDCLPCCLRSTSSLRRIRVVFLDAPSLLSRFFSLRTLILGRWGVKTAWMVKEIAQKSKKLKTYSFEHDVQGQDWRQNFVGQGLHHF